MAPQEPTESAEPHEVTAELSSTGTVRVELQAGLTYEVNEVLSNGQGARYHVTLPTTMSEVSLNTVRVTRDGGATATDAAFQVQLFHRIGAIVSCLAATSKAR